MNIVEVNVVCGCARVSGSQRGFVFIVQFGNYFYGNRIYWSA